MRERYLLDWTVGFSDDETQKPAEVVKSEVPGAVQLDIAKEKGYGPYYFNDNYKDYLWMEDKYWHYSGEINFPAIAGRIFFVCGGIDYKFKVYFKGELLYDYEGMFTPFELELTDKVKDGDSIDIVIFPVPKSCEYPVDRCQANQSCKPAVAYGWDFHPRLIPLGIWDETYIESRSDEFISQAAVFYKVDEVDYSFADIEVVVDGEFNDSAKLKWLIKDACGQIVLEQEYAVSEVVKSRINDIKLWWPNGQGNPYLYTSIIELYNAKGEKVDENINRVGFRTVAIVMDEPTWEEVIDFPKSRTTPPITLKINGRKIFGKGSNFVCPDVYPGIITPERYVEQLDLVKDANMNLLRMWGGAVVNKKSFFDGCDERGIMVWQEFPLACNRYEGTESYLKVLDNESKAIIKKLRQHPCIVIWCGGNELFNSWSRMTDQDLAIRLLNKNCYELDRDKPFLPTSPIMGMAHGHYIFREPNNGREVYQIFSTSNSTAYTEFGVGSIAANIDVLKKIIPEEDLFPINSGTSWEYHHAVAAWEPNSHLTLDVVEDYFGKSKSIDDVIENSQKMQAAGLKCLFEEARRQKPHASMALNWCFNEPWITAANMSIVSYPAIPKKGYYAVKESLRPMLYSAQIEKFRWQEGELFSPSFWLLNDAPEYFLGDNVKIYLRIDDAEHYIMQWDIGTVEANTNLQGPTAHYIIPKGEGSEMKLILRSEKNSGLDSEYFLIYSPLDIKEDEGTRLLNH